MRLLAKISEYIARVLPVFLKIKSLNVHLICPVCLFGLVGLSALCFCVFRFIVGKLPENLILRSMPVLSKW